MPSSTPVYSLPFPFPAEPATVPADLEKLALAIEAILVARAGEYRQDYSAVFNASCTSQTWVTTPSGADATFPLEVVVKNPSSAKLAVTLGAYLGTDDVNSYAEMGFRVYKGAQLLIDTSPARNVLYNGTPGVKATCQRTYMVTVPAPAVVGDLLTVRAYFRNNGTAGTVTFSYPGITVNTRTSTD